MAQLTNRGKSTTPSVPDGIPEGFWLSIDPGEVHVGVTFWQGTEPVRCQEFTPETFGDYLENSIGDISLIAYEIFMLYPGAEIGRNQMGSTFGTCEVIGVIKHLARRNGVSIYGYQASAHKALYKLAEFKPPVKPLRAWKSYGLGPHCKDSENVGNYHLRRISLKGKGY